MNEDVEAVELDQLLEADWESLESLILVIEIHIQELEAVLKKNDDVAAYKLGSLFSQIYVGDVDLNRQLQELKKQKAIVQHLWKVLKNQHAQTQEQFHIIEQRDRGSSRSAIIQGIIFTAIGAILGEAANLIIPLFHH